MAHNKGLKVMIVGCGKVGVALVERLTSEGHDVTMIDDNPAKIAQITNLYDIMGVCGNGASYSIQKDAGIENTDLFIAVTASDELNLLCCTIAGQMGNCAAIARVRTPDYSKETNYLREKLGLAMIINPDLESAREAARILSLPSALKVSSFAHGLAELIRLDVPENGKLAGKSIAELAKSGITADVLIAAIKRGDEVMIPNGATIIQPGDVISFVSSRKKGHVFLSRLGLMSKKVKDCMIIGGGKSSYYLAIQLLARGIGVKIIERDEARCQELSVLLPNAIIINGDGTDEDVLKEEGIETVGAFVALTGIDEENILLTLHAKRISSAKVITKINRIGFKEVIGHLDLGSVIYPRYITCEAIMAYARAKNASRGNNIETLTYLFDNKAEGIEFHIETAGEYTGKPLMDLKLKDNLLICCISRNGQIIIPTGRDTLEVGDSVMVVTSHSGLEDIHDILA